MIYRPRTAIEGAATRGHQFTQIDDLCKGSHDGGCLEAPRGIRPLFPHPLSCYAAVMLDLGKLVDLKRLLVEATDFFQVYGFFMDHFGEKPEMISLGAPLQDPTFVAVMEKIGAQLLGKNARIVDPLLLHLPAEKLIHGGFMIGDHFGCVFYFEDIEKGLAAFGSVEGGPSQLARFSLVTLSTGKSFTLN